MKFEIRKKSQGLSQYQIKFQILYIHSLQNEILAAGVNRLRVFNYIIYNSIYIYINVKYLQFAMKAQVYLPDRHALGKMQSVVSSVK
jgi:hypothetical protein